MRSFQILFVVATLSVAFACDKMPEHEKRFRALSTAQQCSTMVPFANTAATAAVRYGAGSYRAKYLEEAKASFLDYDNADGKAATREDSFELVIKAFPGIDAVVVSTIAQRTHFLQHDLSSISERASELGMRAEHVAEELLRVGKVVGEAYVVECISAGGPFELAKMG